MSNDHIENNHVSLLKRWISPSKILFFISCMTIIFVDANASWLCRQAASERTGDLLNACGIAESKSEGDARDKALSAAYSELDEVCSKSPDCNNFELVIKPLRTDCEVNKQGLYKCYRGIEATITNVKRDTQTVRSFGEKLIIPKKNIVYQDESTKGPIQRTIVYFTSEPSLAQVSVNGVDLCITPCSRELQFGTHLISMQKNSFDVFSEKIKIEGKEKKIAWKLSDQFGYITLMDIPEKSIIKIDDMVLAGTEIKIKGGHHIISVENDLYRPFILEVDISKGEKKVVRYDSPYIEGTAEISAKDHLGNAISANIYVDNMEVNYKTPARIKVRSGERVIKVKMGDAIKSTHVNIEPNTVATVEVVLGTDVESIKRFKDLKLVLNGDYPECSKLNSSDVAKLSKSISIAKEVRLKDMIFPVDHFNKSLKNKLDLLLSLRDYSFQNFKKKGMFNAESKCAQFILIDTYEYFGNELKNYKPEGRSPEYIRTFQNEMKGIYSEILEAAKNIRIEDWNNVTAR